MYLQKSSGLGAVKQRLELKVRTGYSLGRFAMDRGHSCYTFLLRESQRSNPFVPPGLKKRLGVATGRGQKVAS